MISAPPRTILEVFESLPEGTLAQLINDNLVMSPAPKFSHQDICTELSRLLSNYVFERRLGKIISSPIDVYLNNQNVYQPDIIFIAANRLEEVVIDDKVKGVPDLVVEVLSKRTENLDRTTKKAVYESSGVLEYWIIDPNTKNTTGYKLLNAKFTDIPSAPGQLPSVLLNTTISF